MGTMMNKNDLEITRNYLKNYFFWVNKEREYREKQLEWQDKIDDEKETRGISRCV